MDGNALRECMLYSEYCDDGLRAEPIGRSSTASILTAAERGADGSLIE